MTPDELSVCVSSAKKMKQVMQAHLKTLKEKAERHAEPARRIPSRDDFFIYVSDADGFIKMQQDAAFFAETLVVVNPLVHPTFGPTTYEISLTDENSRRELTFGLNPVREVFPIVDGEDTNFVPWETVFPVPRSFQDFTVSPNVDNVDALPIDQVFPRASVLRAGFRTKGTTWLNPDTGLPTVCLVGYKIF